MWNIPKLDFLTRKIVVSDIFSFKSHNISVFVFSLLKVSFMNISCILISIFALLWNFYSKKIYTTTIKSTEQYIRMNEKITRAAANQVMILLLIDTLSKSINYWIRPIFESFILNYCETKLYSQYLNLGYEEFALEGSEIITSRLFRNSHAIKESSSILIFEVIGNIFQLYFSFKTLKNLVEFNSFFIYCGLLGAIFIIHFYFILKLKNLKRAKQDIQDLRAKELTEIFENFILTRIYKVNEHKRLEKYLIPYAVLIFHAISSIIKYVGMFSILILNIHLLLKEPKAIENIGVYLFHAHSISKSINSLVRKIAELESKRIEVSDMIDLNTNQSDFKQSKISSKTENDIKNIIAVGCNDIDTLESNDYHPLDCSTVKVRDSFFNSSNIIDTVNIDSLEENHSMIQIDIENNPNFIKHLLLNNELLQNNSIHRNSIKSYLKYLEPNILNYNEKILLSFSDLDIFVNNKLILSNLNFNIKIGDKIALIGNNGTGKTTLMRFLLGFHNFKGNVSDDFLSLNKEQFSYIPQNNFLFKTIYEELMLFADTEESMKQACSLFNFDKILNKLPNGLETEILNLSNSESQMISIIQAYLKKSLILMADEPTSNLDRDFEELALSNLIDSPYHQVKIFSIHSMKHIHKFNRVFYFC